MRWLIAVLVAPVLLWAALAPSSASARDTSNVGGRGGAEFHDACGAGEAVVGFYYTAGKDLDEIATICQAVQGNKAVGPRHTLPAHGGLSLTVEGTVACPQIMVVQSIHVTISAVNVIHNFWIGCRSLITGLYAEMPISLNKGGEGGGPLDEDCGDQAYALGAWGRAGSLVDALGLNCGVVPPQASPAPAPAPVKPIKHTARGGPTTATPDKPPIKVLDGDDANQNADNGDDGGGPAGGARAATDTTIYDQPSGNDVAYLSGGDPVTIVSCNDENWCRISKPQNGWVWGDDLDR